MKRLLSNVLLVLSVLAFDSLYAIIPDAHPTRTSSEIGLVKTDAIEAPEFVIGGEPEGTSLQLEVYTNEPDIEKVEIWQREQGQTDYVLIHEGPVTQIEYQIKNLKPRTAYEFRARLYRDGEYSPYSNLDHTTYSNFYQPEWYISNSAQGGVDMEIFDRSYADVGYILYRQDVNSQTYPTSIADFHAPDSGSVIKYRDDTALEGHTYRYILESTYENPRTYAVQQEAEWTATQPYPMESPSLVIQGEPEGTHLTLGIYHNEDDVDGAELYQRMAGEEDFVLVHKGDKFVHDLVLKPRTKYYFKARLYNNAGHYSPYSGVVDHTTYSNIYLPTLELENRGGGVGIKVTDNSYADKKYTLLRALEGQEPNAEQFSYTIVLADSGQVWTHLDMGVEDGKTYRYYVEGYFENPRQHVEAVSKNITVQKSTTLRAPDLMGGPAPVSGTTVYIDAYNPNARGKIVFYRSMGDTLNFKRVELVQDGGSSTHYDPNVKPRTVYYYKARVEDGSEVSPYSRTIWFKTYSDFFYPTLTASVMNDGAIKLLFTDNSYADLVYEIERDKAYPDGSWFLDYSIEMRDSGATREFIDYQVMPNTTYTYKVNVLVEDEGMPMYWDIVRVTITTPDNEGPAILGFVLVDPYTDMEVGELKDYDTIPYSARYNIRALASDETQSVQFFLNGKRFGENQVPYALFGDRKGNYHRGRLKPGDYTLTATAYTGNLQRGEEGPTATIHFTVSDEGGSLRMAQSGDVVVAVDVFPNPVVSDASVEVTAPENAVVTIDLRNESGKIVRVTEGKVGADGLLFADWNAAGLPRGTWYMIVKVNEHVYTKRLIIK